MSTDLDELKKLITSENYDRAFLINSIPFLLNYVNHVS